MNFQDPISSATSLQQPGSIFCYQSSAPRIQFLLLPVFNNQDQSSASSLLHPGSNLFCYQTSLQQPGSIFCFQSSAPRIQPLLLPVFFATFSYKLGSARVIPHKRMRTSQNHAGNQSSRNGSNKYDVMSKT